ncbi:hypothetical protein SAMN05216167_1104 [Spirosoma endophyticum]|uniref:Uncharacterized protein n=1 Tax=Spirosoma endophyticum TaxID=662367 RepID=A0A1I1XJK0_9BACT|nr:hypothetical protein SAMN05216167_1104 [Spirosoma endophyticum]
MFADSVRLVQLIVHFDCATCQYRFALSRVYTDNRSDRSITSLASPYTGTRPIRINLGAVILQRTGDGIDAGTVDAD